MVREAACIAIGQFADKLQPDIISHHALVLPTLFRGLSDASEQVIACARVVLVFAGIQIKILFTASFLGTEVTNTHLPNLYSKDRECP